MRSPNSEGGFAPVKIKELRVPVSRAEALKRFYRIIASNEQNTAVLRPK
ncbi:MAG: hypothetical protein ACE14L_01975 [Terriglobales bacterium]